MRHHWIPIFGAVLALGGPARAADIFRYDFEQGGDVKAYDRLTLRNVDAQIVDGGVDGKGRCLRLQTPSPSGFCPLYVKGPIVVQKNLILAFDHREEVEQGFEGAYLGMSFYVAGKQCFWQSDKFTPQWRHAQIEFGKLRPWRGNKVKLGLVFSRIQLYGRVKEKTKVKGQTKARMSVWFDNIRVYTGLPRSVMADVERVSYSNPPFFNWPKPTEGLEQKVQYSLDANFPPGASVTAEVAHNFYTPAKPIEPGKWYWRVWTSNDLSEGWSSIYKVIVPADAHRFVTAPVPVDALARKPRPRLIDVAKLGQPKLTPERKARLIKRAANYYKRGVPEHPGPWVKGDPRWPTWIEWYGRVAGRITGGTGRRLQLVAQCAMLTQDAQVIQWTKEMALEACKWDPEGGSAMRRGDIGAHHLLRGLNWCYDACRDHMTDSERDTLKRIIVQRALQFYHRLNPFRGHEANNHAWLQTLGVGESGLVLLGDCDEAAEWAEYARQLYLGRFLCCLGYQGDNNEGISYWGYGLSFIVQYADMMRAVCGIDLYQHPWLRKTDRFPMYCAPPGAWAVSFADTGMPNHGVRGPAQTGWVRRLALRCADPYALWYSGATDAVHGLAPKPPVDLPQSIHYRHIGWAIFNTSLVEGRECVTVAMHSGKYYAGHQHPDQNHFVIHAYGDKLAIDGGYYDWYGSGHFKAYSATTLAHNTLLVDGQGQAARKRGADGRIADYFDSTGYGYTVGDASDPDIYHGKLKRFDRRILFIKPGFVIVQDLVESADKPVALDWMLHAIVPIQTDDATNAFTITCNNAALRGRMLAPTNVKMQVKTGFPVEPVNRYSTDPVPKNRYFPEWVIYASPSQPAAATEFLAAMQIQRLGDKADPAAKIEQLAAGNAHAVRFVCGDRTHFVLLRKRGAAGALACQGLETDGDAAAIETDAAGAIKRAFAANAKTLRFGGKTLMTSADAKDWAWRDQPELKSGPLRRAWLEVDGQRAELQGYGLRVADRLVRYWWGAVDLPRADRYDIAVEGCAGRSLPKIRLGKQTVELAPGGKPHATLWLQAGRHPLTASGAAFEGITIRGRGVKRVQAEMLPKAFKPAKGSLIVEAEKTSAEGVVKGKLVNKVGASGGRGHCCWDAVGQWAEWAFDVAEAGDYELLVRGASVYSGNVREITLDGKPLAPGLGVVSFDTTGGWCRTTDDWRYFRVMGAPGRPVCVRLSAGRHKLRMVQRGGSMNLDLFAWQLAR